MMISFCPKDSGRNRVGERFTDRHLANENDDDFIKKSLETPIHRPQYTRVPPKPRIQHYHASKLLIVQS